MTITVETVGRDLHVHLEGIEAPFVVKPLPGRAGVQVTDTYLMSAAGQTTAEDFANALIMVVDGGRLNAETGRWEPVPVEEQTTFARIGDELSQSESEAVLMPAFFWQTLLGMDGVRAYIDGGQGMAGTLKATAALSSRLGRLVRSGGSDHV